MPAKATEKLIQVNPIETNELTAALIGESPLILNRPARKAWEQLLLPSGRKNAAARESSLKHNPLEEYRASPYCISDESAPTLLAVMASAFKGAMMTAALDLPGTNKSQIGRLLYVVGEHVPVWGVPQLVMSVTRSADINRTPDIRTRAIVPRWASLIEIRHVRTLVNEMSVWNLLTAAGTTAGIGDWRPEKGKGTFGRFRIVSAFDPEFVAICESGGRAAQVAALERPACYDDDTREMLAWFEQEVVARGKRARTAVDVEADEDVEERTNGADAEAFALGATS